MKSFNGTLSEQIYYWPANMIFKREYPKIAASIKELETRITELEDSLKSLTLKNESLKELI